jgi:serine/threonine-protein kinase
VCLYKHSGEPAWLARAHRLSDYAARSVRVEPLRRDSLYKGEVGVALLAADLEAPDHACMPFFEAEGWPRRGSSIP